MALVNCPECGKEVSESAISCPNCGYGVAQHFNGIKRINEVIEEPAEEIILPEIIGKKKSPHKKLKIIIPCAVVAVGIIAAFSINNIMLSNRTIFKTKQEMYDYLAESYSWSCDDYMYLIFNENGLVEHVYAGPGLSRGTASVELSPSRGKFTFFGDVYTITKDGDIRSDDGHIYHSAPWPWDVEVPSRILKLEVAPINASDGKCTIDYTVTNDGELTYDSIKLETTLNANDGRKTPVDNYSIVKKGSGYTLKAGEVGNASLSLNDVPKDIKSVSAIVKEYTTVPSYEE